MHTCHDFIYLSVMGQYTPPPHPIKTKLKYVRNAQIVKTILISIVFTNKNVFFCFFLTYIVKFNTFFFLHGKL